MEQEEGPTHALKLELHGILERCADGCSHLAAHLKGLRISSSEQICRPGDCKVSSILMRSLAASGVPQAPAMLQVCMLMASPSTLRYYHVFRMDQGPT